MNIAFFGTSSFAQTALQALLSAQHPVVAVVTQPDRPAGRGGHLSASAVKTLAVAHHLPVLQPESCRSADFFTQLSAYAPDLSVVAAYGQFLPDNLLALPRFGSVNLHGSLLPKYRGAAPIQRAIWAGESTTGVCLMWMAHEMDAGDVIACHDEAILPEDNTGTLAARLADDAAQLLLSWLPSLAKGTAPHHPQDPAAVSFAPMIRKEERPITWQRTAIEIWRQVRALAPTPAATALFRDFQVKILAVKPVDFTPPAAESPAGDFMEFTVKPALFIATGDGILEIISIQPAGKRVMSGVDFLRGYHPRTGDHFA